MKTGRLIAVMTCLVALVAAGCKKEGSGGAPEGSYTTIDWSTAGAIQGTIHYVKSPPKPIEIDMSQDPACTLGPALYSEQYVVSNGGGFANVFIYIKDGLGNRVYADVYKRQGGVSATAVIVALRLTSASTKSLTWW